jgi:ERCC4-type nuclease
MLLIVDKSEESSAPKVVNALRKNFSKVIVTNLPHRIYGGTSITAGDINIPLDDGSILAIERKTPDDFLGSISKRHIFNQVEVMAQNAKYSAVIITGFIQYNVKLNKTFIRSEDGKELEKTNWDAHSVQSVLDEIQFSGCPVIFCPVSEYSDQIARLYGLVNKGNDARQSITKNRIITFPPIDERVEFLAQLPGVGMKLADSLLTFAGKMENNADELGYGSVGAALHWMTILSQIEKSERPTGWGSAKILTQRKFMGLASSQYIGLNEEKDG